MLPFHFPFYLPPSLSPLPPPVTPTSPSHSSILLSLLPLTPPSHSSLSLLPIPKCQYIIAADPEAGIGLVKVQCFNDENTNKVIGCDKVASNTAIAKL